MGSLPVFIFVFEGLLYVSLIFAFFAIEIVHVGKRLAIVIRVASVKLQRRITCCLNCSLNMGRKNRFHMRAYVVEPKERVDRHAG